TNPDNFKEIFRSEHTYLLGIKTPCSDNFTHAAETISEQIGLPLKWHRADLRYLEEVLVRTIAQAE
ncbi:MAG: hypothetical protein P1P77_05715, partial [Spirochaetaceae bacterium]|nr:hypothetical protein [Spirochaetaceae bacterium]